MKEENTRVKALRDKLENAILANLSHVYVNGHKNSRLPNTVNFAFDFVEAEAVLLLLDQKNICASSGSACTTGSLDPSHVLKAMGLTPARARGAVRFSLSTYNTEADVDKLIQVLPGIIEKLRKISPLNPEHQDNDKYDVEAARSKHEQEQAIGKEAEAYFNSQAKVSPKVGRHKEVWPEKGKDQAYQIKDQELEKRQAQDIA